MDSIDINVSFRPQRTKTLKGRKVKNDTSRMGMRPLLVQLNIIRRQIWLLWLFGMQISGNHTLVSHTHIRSCQDLWWLSLDSFFGVQPIITCLRINFFSFLALVLSYPQSSCRVRRLVAHWHYSGVVSRTYMYFIPVKAFVLSTTKEPWAFTYHVNYGNLQTTGVQSSCGRAPEGCHSGYLNCTRRHCPGFPLTR